jgi:hypothetical protein
MKLNDRQRELLKALAESEVLPELIRELTADTNTAWQRADTKEKREESWHLARAIKKLGAKLESLIREAKKP